MKPKNAFGKQYKKMFSMNGTPRLESYGVNAVLDDEEAVGSADETGCGAKIPYGDGELDRFLAKRTLKDFVVCSPDAPSL
ncbi:PREDICTED: CLP protease regulatory subunit CLPX2, mitochondrial-like [Theobroma cacao]|uniref:CLP protease regulatory subunit CLPX2, mitochondrial-like n=1 Tax=Theobroma cacao TaxID=3641 RepID=A0AB32WFU2_THECC|nr:PREDICTED: CLP protease regulatory subunit CLPX2, mitochondrial-like [Theobroma cacao]